MSVMKDTFKISRATAQKRYDTAKKLGIIEFDGPPKTGKYILTDKGKKIVEKINRIGKVKIKKPGTNILPPVFKNSF